MDKKLITRNFCCVAAGNFFLFLSFYALMPLLPFYLAEQFAASGSMVGLVLSSYMVACIVVRPLAGYLLDTFRRRPVYLLAYFCFAALFCGYVVATVLTWFGIFRMAHGLAFGAATVSGATLVSQIIPRSRIGEGLGIYGLANTLSMCLGPMLGLAAYHRFSFNTLFIGIAVIAACGLLMASLIKIPPREQKPPRKIAFSSFFIPTGWWASLTQLLVFVPYGATSAYIAVYASELGISGYGGLYFTLMAVGLAVSRPLAGKKVDKGQDELCLLRHCLQPQENVLKDGKIKKEGKRTLCWTIFTCISLLGAFQSRIWGRNWEKRCLESRGTYEIQKEKGCTKNFILIHPLQY